MAKVPLSSIDTALWKLEDPTNLMMITGVLLFREKLDPALLERTIKERLLCFPRFRQKIVEPRIRKNNPYWQDDRTFNLKNHLKYISLHEPADEADLQEVVSKLSSTPLDYNRPLWQFHYVDNYNGGSALICRVHHSIADGMALVMVILSITDSSPDVVFRNNENCGSKTQDDSLLDILRQDFISSRNNAEKNVKAGLDFISHPDQISEFGRHAFEAAEVVGGFLALPPDPDTSMRGKLGTEKRVAWSGPVPLDNIKRIRRKFGGTVNDVLMSLFTGAIRKYFEEQGEPVNDMTIRATIPVSIRQPEKFRELGNQLGAMFISLPINIPDPAERLIAIEHRTDLHKNSLEAPVLFGLLNALGKAPKALANELIKIFSTRASMIMTNVRGPEKRRYIAGVPINEIMFWVPMTGRLGVGVSIISYANQVYMGVASDVGLVPDPEKIINYFCEEYTFLNDQATHTELVPPISDVTKSLDDAISSLDGYLARIQNNRQDEAEE